MYKNNKFAFQVVLKTVKPRVSFQSKGTINTFYYYVDAKGNDKRGRDRKQEVMNVEATGSQTS